MYTGKGVLVFHKEKLNYAICGLMAKTGDNFTKWDYPGRVT